MVLLLLLLFYLFIYLFFFFWWGGGGLHHSCYKLVLHSVGSLGCILPPLGYITLLIICAVSSTTFFCNSPGATSAPNSSRFLFRDFGIVPNAQWLWRLFPRTYPIVSRAQYAGIGICLSFFHFFFFFFFFFLLLSPKVPQHLWVILYCLSCRLKSSLVDVLISPYMFWYYSSRAAFHSYCQSLAVVDVHATYYCKAVGVSCTDSSAQL